METKEIKINCPEGYEIDKENSTFECIKFKKKEEPKFSDYDGKFNIVEGYYVAEDGLIHTYDGPNDCRAVGVFNTEKQARSARAMSMISQIMENDMRFGGPVTDEEWRKSNIDKYCIYKVKGEITFDIYSTTYHFLAFHTAMQETLFMKENEDLVKDYLMIE